jgi:hypothetical protein
MESPLHRPPLTIFLITLAGLSLSVLLIWEGLDIRLFAAFRDSGAFWLSGAETLGIDPVHLGWLWIVLGTSWISSLCGLWLHLSWGRGALWVVSIFSLLYAAIGSILAGIVIIGLMLPASQQWIKRSHASKAR